MHLKLQKLIFDTRDTMWKIPGKGFGLLLLLFEWGTTWPFLLPSLPFQQIPFSDKIGEVVQVGLMLIMLSCFLSHCLTLESNFTNNSRKL